MNQQQKQDIAWQLAILSKKESQNKLARRSGVSMASISQMINKNWDLIRDELWRKVKANLRLDFGWHTAEINNFRGLTELLTTAQAMSLSIAISHDAGAGKSHAYKHYERRNHNVIYIECKNYWSKKSYVKTLLMSSGLETDGTTEQLIERFIAHVKSLERPLIIIDQTDKLKDPQMDLFMDFYNDLEGNCGFFLSGVPAFKKRILRGVQRDKIGYKELYSRIGRKFVFLNAISRKDVDAVCTMNGISDEEKINEIYNTCEGDLRRVRRSVEQHHLLNVEKTAKMN